MVVGGQEPIDRSMYSVRTMLPNFVIAGAAKSATTFVAKALATHPQVFVTPSKECGYFAFAGRDVHFNGPGDGWTNRHIINDLARYESLFKDVRNERAVGEASVHYLARPESFRFMRATLVPEARIILILRNPADRAFSAYGHYVRDGREDLDFGAALSQEEHRLAAGWEDGWGYRKFGCYVEGVTAALDAFGKRQVGIWLYDALADDPGAVLVQVCQFLEVSPGLCSIDLQERVNPSGIPRSKFVSHFLADNHLLKKVWRPLFPARLRSAVHSRLLARNIRRAESYPDIHAQLIDGFRDEIGRLSEITGIDTSHWLADESAKPRSPGSEHIA